MPTQTMNETIEERMDQLEERLPALPAAAFRIQRTVTCRMLSAANDLAGLMWGSARRTAESTSQGVNTVTGTARHEAEETMERAGTAARRLTGQARGQARRVVDTADAELDELTDDVEEAVDRAEDDLLMAADAVEQAMDPDRTPSAEVYEDMTKAELYDRASELEIQGRSKMSKDELIDALVEHRTAH